MQVLIGFANKVNPDYPDNRWTRLYRAHGATWLGIDTEDVIDICSDECLATYTKGWVETGPGQFVGGPQYGAIPTLDIVSDEEPVDNPAHCAVCHDLIDRPLTTYGEAYIAESVEEALRNPNNAGDLDVIASWADNYPEARWAFADSTYYRVVAYNYVRAALWTSGLSEQYQPDEVIPDDDLLDFIWANVRELAGLEPAFVGSNFWLSRNGEGTGYFAYGLDALQAQAESYGSKELLEVDGRVVFD